MFKHYAFVRSFGPGTRLVMVSCMCRLFFILTILLPQADTRTFKPTPSLICTRRLIRRCRPPRTRSPAAVPRLFLHQDTDLPYSTGSNSQTLSTPPTHRPTTFNMSPPPPGYPSPSLAAQYDQGFLAQAWDEQCRLRARQKAHKNTALRAKGKSTAPPMPKRTDGGCLSRLAAAFGFGKKGLKSCLRGGGDKGGRKRRRSVSFAEAPPAVVLVPNANRGKKVSVSRVREVGPGGIASMGGAETLAARRSGRVRSLMRQVSGDHGDGGANS